MKKCLLLILILASFQGYSKKKDPRDLKIDSLTKVTDTLTIQLNAASLEVTAYHQLYNTIKEKVLKSDFDPARFSDIIDSLRATRDSEFNAKMSANLSKDSLSYLNSEKSKLKEDSEASSNQNRIVIELKQLKELLDAKILTFTEFDEIKKKLLERW